MSTYVPIQAITLSAATADVTFTGIPQTFTDLVLVVGRLKSTTSSPYLCFQFNSNTSTDYSVTHIEGTGSSAVSSRLSSQNQITTGNSVGLGTTADAMVITHFMNYSNTTTNKTAMSRVSVIGGSFPGTGAAVGLWRQTSAITSIRVFNNAGNLPADCTLTLYGIGSGAPKAFGGDEVRTDGTFWYHIFRSSGRFEPVENLSNVDFLVIAGGGGGGRGDVNNNGGGGGAGGYRTSAGTSGGGAAAQSKLSLSANTSYTVTVGAGGAGGANDYTGGSNGGSSSFSTVSTTGGGGGGAVNSPGGGGKGRDGGSGGGSGDFNNNWTGGLGTANEGFDGGSGVGAAGTSRNMGGGGGAGGAGASYVTQTGGAGVASTITGTSVTRAVGGNGSNAGGSAGANTGSGGNGNRSSAAGNGGSGFIVVRYSV